MRLHEASKKFNLKNREFVDLLATLGFQVKEHPFTVVGEDMMAAVEKHLQGKAASVGAKPPAKPAGKISKPPESKLPVGKPVVPLSHPIQPSQNSQQSQQSKQSQGQPRVQPQVSKPVSPVQPPKPLAAAVGEQKPVVTAHQTAAPVVGAVDHKEFPKAQIPIVVKDKDKEKKTGPKPLKFLDDEEVEVNQQLTIIKTAPVKKEAPPKKLKKKKEIKRLLKGPHFPKKMIEEQREAEDAVVIDESAVVAVPIDTEEPAIPQVTIPQEVTVNELAKYLEVQGVEIVKKLMGVGIFASLNQRLEPDQIEIIGREFGHEILFSDDVIELDEEPDEEGDLVPRPPVVTIMGHVDHGKTSLLDKIRHAQVAEGEYGGITQHIGAYQVKTPQGLITFLDTPGHEAFTAMRAQGALVTDIAILVVAADDGVQPQTIEAIHHAQAAKVPIIVAVNKIDKADANAEKVKQQLMPYNLVAEDWGGKTIMVPVSAKRGDGIETLLEMILLQAEIMELKANPDRAGKGTIIEAKLDKGMGPMATVLIQNGRIEVGDNLICGTSYGRIKALITDSGARVQEGGASFPVAVLGLNEVPRVGDKMMVVESAKFARYVGLLRLKKEREERLTREKRLKLTDLFQFVTEGKVKELGIIIKADVQGSAGALKDSLERLSTAEVKVNAIHAGVGAITESDVMLAAASNAIIIGFHVRPALGVDDLAAKEGVEIKVFRIIYDAIDAVKLALKGMYEPVFEEEVLGRAEVRKVFKITGTGAVAGSYVLDGKVQRDATARLIREGVEVYEGKLSSLKRFKDDVREVSAGFECGISIVNYNDLKEKDVLEFFRLKEVPRP